MADLEPYRREEIDGIIADQPNIVYASLQEVIGSEVNISGTVSNQEVDQVGFVLLKGPLNETVSPMTI